MFPYCLNNFFFIDISLRQFSIRKLGYTRKTVEFVLEIEKKFQQRWQWDMGRRLGDGRLGESEALSGVGLVIGARSNRIEVSRRISKGKPPRSRWNALARQNARGAVENACLKTKHERLQPDT